MLKVRNLSVHHTLGTNLVDISLSVGRGEVVAVIGAEDAGISLLFSTIANPDSQHQGDITLSHYKSASQPEKVRRLRGVLNQPFEPPLHLTGYEYLELIGSFYGLMPEERASRIIQLAAKLECNRFLHTVMEQVSAATKQKIGIIASVISSPAVLLWNEPLLFLDPSGQQAVRKIFDDQAKNSTAILLASNNLEFVQEVAQTVILLSNGQIAAQGTVAELSRLAQTSKNLPAIYDQLSRRS